MGILWLLLLERCQAVLVLPLVLSPEMSLRALEPTVARMRFDRCSLIATGSVVPLGRHQTSDTEATLVIPAPRSPRWSSYDGRRSSGWASAAHALLARCTKVPPSTPWWYFCSFGAGSDQKWLSKKAVVKERDWLGKWLSRTAVDCDLDLGSHVIEGWNQPHRGNLIS